MSNGKLDNFSFPAEIYEHEFGRTNFKDVSIAGMYPISWKYNHSSMVVSTLTYGSTYCGDNVVPPNVNHKPKS